jgi:hypothetical protein
VAAILWSRQAFNAQELQSNPLRSLRAPLAVLQVFGSIGIDLPVYALLLQAREELAKQNEANFFMLKKFVIMPD